MGRLVSLYLLYHPNQGDVLEAVKTNPRSESPGKEIFFVLFFFPLT